MAGASVRRPIPAVVFILLLSLLSAIVWYRVLNRAPASTTPRTKTSTAATPVCPPKPAAKTTAKARANARSKTSSKSGTTVKTSARTTSKAAVTTVPWPKTSAVHLTVLNGSARNGLAKSVAAQLKSRGFAIGTITNDTVKNSVTQVRYGTRATTAARLVALYLPGAKLVANTSKATTVTVSLGSSYTHLASNAAVAKAKRTTATC